VDETETNKKGMRERMEENTCNMQYLPCAEKEKRQMHMRKTQKLIK